MTKNWTMLLALAVACPLAIGCGQTSEKGGPGARPGAGDADEAADDAKTFTITVPGDMSIDQGKQEEIEISVNRGDEFEESITLVIETSAGVTADPAEIEAPAADESVKVMLKAAATAAPGDVTVTVKGTPETGSAVSESFKVTVNEAEGADEPAPVDPRDDDPAPLPLDPLPADPADADPAPADPADADPAPADPADADADPAPADPADADADPAPADADADPNADDEN